MLGRDKKKPKDRFKEGENRGSLFVPWDIYEILHDRVFSKDSNISKYKVYNELFVMGFEKWLELEKLAELDAKEVDHEFNRDNKRS